MLLVGTLVQPAVDGNPKSLTQSADKHSCNSDRIKMNEGILREAVTMSNAYDAGALRLFIRIGR